MFVDAEIQLKMDGDQVDKELKISMRNHLNAAASIPFFIVVSMLMVYLFGASKATFIGLAIWLGINIIPTIFLHIEYYLKNKGERYELKFDELIRYKDEMREVYKVSDIEYIEVFMSPAVYR